MQKNLSEHTIYVRTIFLTNYEWLILSFPANFDIDHCTNSRFFFGLDEVSVNIFISFGHLFL